MTTAPSFTRKGPSTSAMIASFADPGQRTESAPFGVAVRSEQLRAIPRVIGVAASAEKGIAAVALARAGLLTELVVDVQLADEAIRIAEGGAGGDMA